MIGLGRLFRQGVGRRAAFALFLAFGLVLVVAGCGPFVDSARQYDHATDAAGPPGTTVSERFVAPCNGLTAIDVQVARYPNLASKADHLALTLTRATPSGQTTVAAATFDAAALQSNAWIRFAFAPIASVPGQPLVLTAQPSGAVTLWADGTAEDASLQRFVGVEPAPGVVVARMSCDEPPVALVRQTLERLLRDGWLWPVELGLEVLPGLAIALWLSRDERDPLWLLGRGVSWSALLAPLLLAALTPLRAGSLGGGVLLLGGMAGIAGWWWIRWARAPRPRPSGRHGGLPLRILNAVTCVGARACTVPGIQRPQSDEIGPDVLLLAALAFLGGFALRAVQARDLPLPLWVDSPQHSYVVGRILAEGGVPATYGTLMPPQVFDYHFGFQALAAYGSWLTGVGPAAAVLASGQVLSAVFCFAMYALIRDLDGTPLSAVVGAVLVALVTTYPTYYVTWGRYPELAGLVALPAAFACLKAVGSWDWRWRDFLAAALASIGTIFVHPRVAVFLAGLLAAALLVRLTERAIAWTGVVRILAAGGAGLVLGFPWIMRLWVAHHAATVSSSVTATGAPLDFPWNLVLVGNDTTLIGLAAAGLIVTFIRRRRLAMIVIVWCALVFLLANLNWLGVPVNLWLNGNSVAIAVFVPVVILVGSLAGEVASLASFASWPRIGRMGVVVVAAALALSRWPGMVTLVNPCCSLVGPGDLAAMAWVHEHTAPSARIVVNDYLWQGSVWAGSDAGSWLPVLAERATTLPPMFYAVGPPPQVRRIDDQARFFSATNDPAALARAARCLGADYVFIGAKGGPIDPRRLVASGLYKVDYRSGGAWVLEFTTGGATSATVTSCIPAAGEAPSSEKAAGLKSTTRG